MANNIIAGIDQLTDGQKPSVVSIGNYDGVHLGNQYVVESLLKKGAELGVPSTVITFEPLAKEFFQPNAVARITSLEQRADLLSSLGVDQVLAIDFTRDFANYSPTKFVHDVLLEGLGAKYLCVGDDFRFGKDRVGDFVFLQEMGKKYQFPVEAHSTFEFAGERVSSGRVRQALSRSDFALTATLLGRAYSISGVVSKGDQIGRTIQFPTANIVLGEYVMAVQGVFAVQCQIGESEEWLDGVANIGQRPTVSGKQNRLEVHLFDFDRDIYGLELDVRLISKIRDEKKFENVQQLQAQIKIDADMAKTNLDREKK